MLEGVGEGVGGPDRGGLLNNGVDHHLVTIVLNRSRALVKITTQKSIYLVCFASDSLNVFIP